MCVYIMYIYICVYYVYIYMCIYMCIYIYVYILGLLIEHAVKFWISNLCLFAARFEQHLKHHVH
jgi:hypothetical protein